ncbi:glycosyltransferase family 4 protein [Frankia sp. R43]|uniref:glycosyltransferase family 4 protein n=1 Tax=Frankia sp. R43 TaxID=269536 RepID=UPI000B2A9D91|nr:glycosyltransferase family 4 protein [Frankia sp. R43]
MTAPVTGGSLKVLFLCEQYPPIVWDGAGIYTAVIAGALAALGHEVHVLCAQGHRIVDEIHDGVRVHRRPLLRVPVTRMLGRYGRVIAGRHHPRDSLSLRASLAASYAFWLRRLGLRPDVIETQDGDSRGLIRILGHSHPLVIHLHCPTMLPPRLSGEKLSWKGRVADRVDRAVVAWADAVTAPSELMVTTLRELGWLTDRPVEIIPNPFDATCWRSVAPPRDTEPVIAVVGRIEREKGVNILLDAVAKLRADGLEAQIVLAGTSAGLIGGVPTRAWLARRAEQLDVPCTFAGHVPLSDLAEIYGRARVVAVPSRFESMSMAAIEAMASGRPVVATARTGIAPYLERHGAGAVVPPDDPEALAAALRPLLVDPELAVTVGARGRAAVADFEPRAVAMRRERVYRQAISRFETRRGTSSR